MFKKIIAAAIAAAIGLSGCAISEQPAQESQSEIQHDIDQANLARQAQVDVEVAKQKEDFAAYEEKRKREHPKEYAEQQRFQKNSDECMAIARKNFNPNYVLERSREITQNFLVQLPGQTYVALIQDVSPNSVLTELQIGAYNQAQKEQNDAVQRMGVTCMRKRGFKMNMNAPEANSN
ncbi:hypothetical protein [Paraburkholderia sediminicola]|uniref:hypothetical protein n=1 Tax=Paraburkholderia sediminicola TaxID=458836 RepID=UPI0038BD7905